MFFKKRKNKISMEAFGERILSKFILTSGDRFFELAEDLNKNDFFDYLLYIQYLLYISQKILELKYTQNDVKRIINASINGIVDLFDTIDSSMKLEFKKHFKEGYIELFDDINLDIFKEELMHELVTYFENDLNLEPNALNHQLIFVDFTLFIKYHASDILNDDIILV